MKARVKNRIVLCFKILFCSCFIILNPSCGLDEYYVLSPPSSIHTPIYSSTNTISYENRYFEFTTDENRYYDDKGFTFQGTAVYYKLYSNLSTCESEYKALNTMVNTDSTKANAATSMINSYKFQPMQNLYSDDDVLIPHTSSEAFQTVRIRLTQYLDNQNEFDFVAQISIFRNGDYSFIGVPARYYGDRQFDFYRNNTATGFYAPIPRTTSYEDDVSTSTSVTKDNIWYITLFAVGQGYDASFTSYYSTIVYLGTLAIDASSSDN